jgi:S1-C subfamily serine protease/tetratricopeptide (TPR) repeat protein
MNTTIDLAISGSVVLLLASPPLTFKCFRQLRGAPETTTRVFQKRVLSLLVMCFVLFCAPAIAKAQVARAIAHKTFPSVVLLTMESANGEDRYLGSGFFVREGIVATNFHVVKGSAKGSARVVGMKTEYPIAGIVGIDRERDLVLLSVPGAKAPSLPLGDSSQLAVGDEVYVVGNPKGLEGTFSQGIVSAIRQAGSRTLIQVTAPISPGSSGGPVLNSRGDVIGIAVATIKGGQNLNFAVPSLYLSPMLAELKPVRPLFVEAGPTQPPRTPRERHRAEATPSQAQSNVASRSQRCSQLDFAGEKLEANGQSSAALAKYREAELECHAAEAEGDGIPLILHYILGHALAGQKRWDGAIAEYRESMSLGGREDYSDCHVGIGEALEGKGDLDGAIAEYRLALQTHEPIGDDDPMRWYHLSSLSNIHWRLALVLSDKHDIDGAIGECREAVRLTPSDAANHEYLGSLIEQTGDLQEALKEYSTAHELDPNYSEAREDFERVKEKVANQEDIRKWQEYVRRSPDDAAGHKTLAIKLQLSGDLDGEIAEWGKLVFLEPAKVENRNFLGLALLRKGDLETAMAEFHEILLQEPDYDPAHLGLCRALDQKGDSDGALAECREAVRLGPYSDTNHRDLGNLLFRKNDIDGAIAEYREAVRLLPKFSKHHTDLANVLTWKGDWTSAAKEFREAIRLDPDDDAAHYGLGLALEHQGDRRSALAEYRKACDLDPKNPKFQGDYERLLKETRK